jgi:excisionase family DNA binding protein
MGERELLLGTVTSLLYECKDPAQIRKVYDYLSGKSDLSNEAESNMRLLSISQCGKKINRSRSTVYRWINDGNLNAVKTGESGTWCVKEAELVNFFNNLPKI